MAARKPPKHGRAWTPEKVRERIRIGLIIHRLEKQALDQLPPRVGFVRTVDEKGNVVTAKQMIPTAMSKQALKAALGIVGICMPRPQTVEIEHSGSITVIDRDPTKRPADYSSKRRKAG